MTVSIIDYGMGNLDSVARAVEHCGGRPRICSNPDELGSPTHLILPGVGAFDRGVRNLRARGMVEPLEELVRERSILVLGLCLGMQLLAERGMEGTGSPGLGWIAGEVVRLEGMDGERVPHVGWNEVMLQRTHPLLDGIPSGSDFFFTHSYRFDCRKASNVLAITPYDGGFTSIVGDANVLGVQFHPEKSQRMGLRLIRNFLNL